ncbi:MAG: T9SS type A sorting domain-containing protein [Bacteroidota bacterium]
MNRRCVSVLLAGWVLSLGFLLSLSTAPAQDLVPLQFPSERHCATIAMNEPHNIREAVENTRRMYPGIEEAMRIHALKKSHDLVVGTQELFWVRRPLESAHDTVRAELMATSNQSYVWVAVGELDNGHVTMAEVEEIVRALEQRTPAPSQDSTRGILDLEKQYFGLPPNVGSDFTKGAGDGKSHFLICDIQDGWTGSGSFIAGFFYSLDVNPSSGFQNFSNRRDLLYIDSYPSIFFNNNRRTSLVLSTLAHEFQHLIHWNYDPLEITFFNEGLSEYAEGVCGYPLRSPAGYLQDTNVPLTGWSNSLDDYSRAALWTRYLAEQYGLEFIRRFTQHPSNGIPGFQAALQQAGIASDFDMTGLNFFTANWLGDNALALPQHRYASQLGARPFLLARYFDPNASGSLSLQQQAVEYMEFSPGAKDFKILFSGQPGLRVRAVETGPSMVRVRELTPGVEFFSADFGTSLSSIVFVISNANLTSPVNVSYAATGEVIHFIAEERYDDGFPTPFTEGIAPYVGFGNSSATRGVAVRFVPKVPTNVLRSARMMIAFNQEFINGTALPEDDRDFMFYVWGDDNGKPGPNLITPFLVTVDRSVSPVATFVDIDLAAYANQLTNLAGPVYLGFLEDEDDSVGTYAAVDNTTLTDYSYVYRGPNHPRAPDTWETFRNVSALNNNILDGFNAMFRAVFEYTDSSAAPLLALGYLQNPLLSEYIDVVVAGSDELRPASLSGSMTQTGGAVSLRFVPVPGTTRVFIDTTQTLTGSGSVSIRARAAKRYGVFHTDTLITFAAQLLKQHESTTLVSTNGWVSLRAEPGSVRGPVYLTLFEGIAAADPDVQQPSEAVRMFTIGPSGFALEQPASITVADVAQADQFTLALRKNGLWLEVPTTRERGTSTLAGSVRELGVFGVVRKSEIDGQLENVPTEFALFQNYPNPFNPLTTIRYELPNSSRVQLRVYDILGKEVAVLVEGEQPAGRYSVRFDGSSLPTGIYFYRLVAGTFIETRKGVLLK